MEVWGASGGGRWNNKVDNTVYSSSAGAGGYSVGVYKANLLEKLYIVVGGEGVTKAPDASYCTSGTCSFGDISGGYNGGGGTYWRNSQGTGGGATHIAKTTNRGVLSNYNSYRSEVLIVAGGGGGSDDSSRGDNPSDSETGSTCGAICIVSNNGSGGNGGGYSGQSGMRDGSFDNSNTPANGSRLGGTQSTGYAFGQGEKGGQTTDSGAGGGGWFGGYAGTLGNDGGGGGSGYINSSSLISVTGTTKHMACYTCATSSSSSTYTISSSTKPSLTATADVAKIGNGYAKITWLGV